MLRMFRSRKEELRSPDNSYLPSRPCTVDVKAHYPQYICVPLPPPEASIRATTAQSTARPPPPTASGPNDTATITWNIPPLPKTQWEPDNHRKKATSKRSHPPYEVAAKNFEKLPRDVYDCIIIQLERIHLREGQACPSCYLRDLHSLSLTSRAWDKAATAFMYRKVVVLANDEHTKAPKLKVKGTTRLKLLRRTLREKAALARLVRELHLSQIHALYENASIEREEIVNLVASLVMATPLLARVVGFHIPYRHSFDRLSHALSTRQNLTERLWLLANADAESEDENEDSANYYHAACDPTERFLQLNSRHALLSTLVLHQEEGHTLKALNFRAVVGTIRSYPNLHHLAISGLAASSFTNLALNSLPSGLRSLRLESLAGINEKGLQRFFSSQQANSIVNLTLIDLDVRSLGTVSHIFSSHMGNLDSFSFVQEKAPGLSGRTSVPTFSSLSLRKLHWEFRSEAGPLPPFPSRSSMDTSKSSSFPFTNAEPICCLATSLLATSIRDGGFPSLRRIRIPHDPQGVIQALCKPLATALLPWDITLYAPATRISSSNAFSITIDSHVPLAPKVRNFSAIAISHNSRSDSAVGSTWEELAPSELTPMRTRLAAQARILAAKRDAGIVFRVFDPDGELRIDRVIGGYVGHIGSSIKYELEADADRGLQTWMADVHDLTGRDKAAKERESGSCDHLVYGNRHSVARMEDLFR